MEDVLFLPVHEDDKIEVRKIYPDFNKKNEKYFREIFDSLLQKSKYFLNLASEKQLLDESGKITDVGFNTLVKYYHTQGREIDAEVGGIYLIYLKNNMQNTNDYVGILSFRYNGLKMFEPSLYLEDKHLKNGIGKNVAKFMLERFFESSYATKANNARMVIICHESNLSGQAIPNCMNKVFNYPIMQNYGTYNRYKFFIGSRSSYEAAYRKHLSKEAKHILNDLETLHQEQKKLLPKLLPKL